MSNYLNVQTAVNTSAPFYSLTLSAYAVPAGSNKILKVVILAEDGNFRHISSVTHNSVAMTSIGVSVDNSATDPRKCWIYYLLLGSTTPTGDIVVTWTGNISDSAAIIAYTVTGLKQQAPEATATNATGTTSVSTNITTVTANAIILDGLSSDATDTTAPTATGTGHTSLSSTSDNTGGAIQYAAGYVEATTATSYSLGWSGTHTAVAHVVSAWEVAADSDTGTAIQGDTIGTKGMLWETF